MVAMASDSLEKVRNQQGQVVGEEINGKEPDKSSHEDEFIVVYSLEDVCHSNRHDKQPMCSHDVYFVKSEAQHHMYEHVRTIFRQ